MDISYNVQRLQNVNQRLNPIFQLERKYLKSNNLKIKYYKVFQIYLICYWSMEVAVLSLRPFLALYHEWIFVLVQQILTLISMSFLFITLTYSIEFETFEGTKDGAILAPNPYIKGRVPKICGEFIVVQTVCEKGFPEHSIGVECYQPAKPAEASEVYISRRARVYQSSSPIQNETSIDLKNSRCNVLGKRHKMENIDLEKWSSSSSENEKEFEPKEESKYYNISSKRRDRPVKALIENSKNQKFKLQDVKVIDFRNMKLKTASRKVPKKEEEKELPKAKPKEVGLKKQSLPFKEIKHVVDFRVGEVENNSSLSLASPEMVEVEFI